MMMIHYGCAFCLHFQKVDNGDPKFYCDAFPKKIPDEIVRMKFDHRKPHPDDNGIQFEMNPQFENFREDIEEAYTQIEKNIQMLTELENERDTQIRKAYRLDEDADLEVLKAEIDRKNAQRVANARQSLIDEKQKNAPDDN